MAHLEYGDVNRVHINKDETDTKAYEEYKSFDHAVVEREGTADEFLVFYTIGASKVKELVEEE